MPIFVYGSAPSKGTELEPCTVTIIKPSGSDYRFRIGYTGLSSNGGTYADYDSMSSSTTQFELEILKNSMLCVMNYRDGSLSYNIDGDAFLMEEAGATNVAWFFEVYGNCTILFTN